MSGRSANARGQGVARDVDFLKKLLISRFRNDSVHLEDPMGPALTDGPGAPEKRQKSPQIRLPTEIARPGSERHFHFSISHYFYCAN